MRSDHRLGIAVGLDTFVVVLFVAIGRRTHDQGSALAGVIETAVPFLIGLLAGWMLTRAWRHPWRLLTGLVIWPVTVLVGMMARNLVFDRGTAAAFVAVATMFLGAGLVGWRAIAPTVERRRRPAPPVVLGPPVR